MPAPSPANASTGYPGLGIPAPAAAVADRPPPIRSVLGVAILLLPLSLLCALPFTVVAAALGHSESFCDVLGG